MRGIHRTLAGLVSAALAGGTLLLSAAPASAAASPTCPSTVPVSGSVNGAVAQNTTDWYFNNASGTRTFTLSPWDGDADLVVKDAACGTTLCTSSAGGTYTDSCTITASGPVMVGARYFSGGPTVSYTLYAPMFETLPTGTGYPSDDCLYGTTVADGFVAGNYVSVRSRNADATTRWICVRAEGPGLTYGGKFVVTGAGVTLPALPRTDSDIAACAVTPNAVPGPHPALSGALGDPSDPATYLPFLLDSRVSGSDAFVCVGAGTFKVRAIVSTGISVSPPNVSFQPDLPGSHTIEPPLGSTPSAACQGAMPYGVTRYTDVNVEGARTFLYTWQTGSAFKICVRTQGLANAGGVLTVDTGNVGGALPSVTTGGDLTGCTVSVAHLDSPTLVDVRRSATGALPASACVTIGNGSPLRITAATGNGQPPATVTWTPDPGTP